MLSISIGVVISILTRRIEGGRTEDEILEAAPRPVAKLRRFTDKWSFRIVTIAIVSGFLVFGGAPAARYVAIGVCWVLVAFWVVNHPRMRERFISREASWLFAIVPVLLLFVGMAGATNAWRDRMDSRPTAVLKSSSDPSKLIRARPIRHFERVVLVVDDQGLIRALRADDLLVIENFPRPYYYSGAVCQFFDVLCYPIESAK